MPASSSSPDSARRPALIIGRLADALRGVRGKAGRTDWWSVLIEIMVVVLGILIAFELNEWDQRRQDRAQEQLVLQHIREESRGDMEALERIRDQHIASVRNARQLLGADGNPAAARAYAAARGDRCDLLRVPAVRRASAGAGGLGGPDRLAVIHDHRLRDLLRVAEAARVFSESQIGYFRDSFQRYAERLDPYTVWQLESGPSCTIDAPALSRDGPALRLLQMVGRDQLKLAEYRDTELQATAAVLDRVRCLQERRCLPQD